jgi:putative ubiquitin-RnfH superfamily antitoxin RatB of RatAB toxin-antitoxin module
MASAEAGDGAASPGALIAVELIAVELAWSAAPQQLQRLHLQLPVGSTALAALRASGLADRLDGAVLDSLTLALWGRAIPPETVLRDLDRLELLRPLQVDPKEARRLRYRRDGIRPRRKQARR